ncbi:MAG: hypothetical protein PVJ67_01380 [Candidatus Pacearchaeota archaeon]|jgi:hypothetical protein
MNDYEGGKEEYGYTDYPEKSSNWKIWLMFIIPALLIFGLVIFIYVNLSDETISDTAFVEGATIELKENKQAEFTVGDEEHFIKINSVGLDSISLVIHSEPIELDIKIGEEIRVDINSDGLSDIIVKLAGINNGVPQVYMRRIYEEEKQKFEERKNSVIEKAREKFSEEDLPELEKNIRNASTADNLDKLERLVNNSVNVPINFTDNSTCVGKWFCENWGSCIDGTQMRDCSAIDSCEIIEDKPAMIRNCTSSDEEINCTESWMCENWSSCVEGKQTRNCEDLNNCGSILSKPNRERVCDLDEEECVEDWACGNWSFCVNRKKIRECRDLNSCDTFYNEPNKEIDCEYAEEVVDCEGDINCFKNLAIECRLAKVSYERNVQSSDTDGTITLTSFMEIKGIESEKCILHRVDSPIEKDVTCKINKEYMEHYLEDLMRDSMQGNFEEQESCDSDNMCVYQTSWGEYICEKNF